MTTRIKIGIVGSRSYTDKKKVKDLIFNIKEKYGDEVEIVSGGQPKGADGLAKKYALEFDTKYVEFPPAHYQYNQHCVLESYNYGKQYAVWHYHNRNKEIVNHSDVITAFIPKGITSKGTNSTLKEAEKVNKKTVIIN